MNIVFYGNHPYYGGLQTNGGSRTILLSAQELRNIGHKVDVVACVDRFTWFPHPPVIRKVPKNTDIIIAVSISDAKEIYKKYPDKKLAYWARPFETWQKSEEKCIKILKKFQNKHNGIIMCNSSWQTKFLKIEGIKSHLILSGQELCYRKHKADNNSDFTLTIGCQYSNKPRKGWKKFKKLAKMCPEYEYVAFGSEKCKDKFLSKYLRNPERRKLNELYRNMDIFFVGNTLEGFLNVALEASLQGCLLVVNDCVRNGVWDYCTKENCHVYKKPEDIPQILQAPDFARVAINQESIYKNIPTRRLAMEKMIEVLK